MMQANVHRLSMAHPGDLSALESLIQNNVLKAENIKAIIGKTEGNGGVNDFTRGYFTQSLMYLLAQHTNLDPDELKNQVPCVLSGGTEGVLSPHYLVFSAAQTEGNIDPDDAKPSLAIGTAFSAPTPAEHIGRWDHIHQIAEAVKTAMRAASLEDTADVHFVQVKSPCITIAKAQDAINRGETIVTSDPNRSMAYARIAAAWGVGLALGEIDEGDISPEDIFTDVEHYSTRASTSSGIEVDCNEVIVLGNSTQWQGPLHIAHTPMQSAIDIEAIYTTLAELGFPQRGQLTAEEQQQIHGTLVKCEPDRRGNIHGKRHTMLDDTDINAQRHIRGAVGGLVAGVLGDTRIFVSGGAENQGPDGGGLIAIISAKK